MSEIVESEASELIRKRSLRASEVEKILQVSRSMVVYLLRKGKLDGYQITPRGQWRIFEDSLAALIREGRGGRNRAEYKGPMRGGATRGEAARLAREAKMKRLETQEQGA